MRKIKMGLKLNGKRIGGISYGIQSHLTEFPEITLPKSKFRKDVYTSLTTSYNRFVKLTERDTGNMSLTIETVSPLGSRLSGGETDFFKQVINPLSKQALIKVEFDEFPNLVYVCTLSRGVEEQGLLGKSRSYRYEVYLDIEWVERVVYNNVKNEYKTYPLEPTGHYYLTYTSETIKDSLGYYLNDNLEDPDKRGVSYIHHFYNLYNGWDTAGFSEFLVDMLSLTVTSGDRVIGIALEPFQFITGANNIQLFTVNGPGTFSVMEVL